MMELSGCENTLLDYLKLSLEGMKNNPFVEFYGKKITYRTFFDYVDRCAENLARIGVNKDSVVTVLLPNCPQFAVLVYALSKIGAVASLLSPLLTKGQVQAAMERTHSTLLFLSTLCDYQFEGAQLIRVNFSRFMGTLARFSFSSKKHYTQGAPFEPLLKKPKPPFLLTQKADYTCPAFYLHSGGTTGEPKTVMLSQRAINYCAYAITDNLHENGFEANQQYTAAYILPMFYGYGLGVFHTQTANGFNQLIRAKFKPSHLVPEMKKYGVDLMYGVPAMYRRMLEKPGFNQDGQPKLKLCYLGGEKLSAELESAFAKAFPNAMLLEGYGLSETVNAFVSCSKLYRKKGSCGRIWQPNRIEAFSQEGEILSRGQKGELCVATYAVMEGYYDDIPRTEAVLFDYDGRRWLKTGDYGYVDSEGFVFLVQRLKNIIKRNGISIYPSQIEACIQSLPYIKENVVFGLKDKTEVERIICAAVPQADAVINEEELKNAVRQQLSVLYTPEYILICNNLPLTRVGKVDILQLSSRVGEENKGCFTP